jgi:TolA-binding protein
VGGSLPERRPPPENPLPPPPPEEPPAVQRNPSPSQPFSVRERTAEELFRLGSQHFKAGELGAAVEKLSLYLERAGNTKQADEALYLIGRAELGRGRPYAAAMNFRQLVEVFPRSPRRPEALFYGGEAYHRMYDKVQALRLWKELEARYPSHSLTPKAQEAIRRMASER